MRIEFVSQPEIRVGDIIEELIGQFGTPEQLSIVSAFASLPTVLRIKPHVESIAARGGLVTLTLGVDLGGTSKEVLREVASWPAEVWIFKNRVPGITFHPKVYLLRWPASAEIIVGSNNLTDGGLYRNYEAATRTTFSLPVDEAEYQQAIRSLRRFLQPDGPTAVRLTPEYLERLLILREIPSEVEARRTRGEHRELQPTSLATARATFGYESVPLAPRLPVELQRFLLSIRDQQQAEFQRRRRRAARAALENANADQPLPELIPQPSRPELPAQLDAQAFYINPVTSRNPNNPNIPGEQRIPLEALEVAQEFWGWPDNYTRKENPRGGSERVYMEWKPRWRISSTDDPMDVQIAEVRMYLYENSSDFRFYAGRLVRMQAAPEDILRFRRIDNDEATFECVLARQGSAEHTEWQNYLEFAVKRNPARRFGFH